MRVRIIFSAIAFILSLVVPLFFLMPVALADKEPLDEHSDAEVSLPVHSSENASLKSGLSLSRKPALIEADALDYQQEERIVTAHGNVQVSHDGRILLADSIIYFQKEDRIEAKGNIALMNKDGTVFFAQSLDLSDSFRQGVIENFSARMNDDSLFASTRADRQGQVVTLYEGVYSPCPVCQSNPLKPSNNSPLWQIKSEKTVVDQEQQRVSYKNAFLEVKGVPVLYTPYLSHPTPGASRKTGLLIPSYRSDSVFGTSVTTPYYYSIAPDKDITLTPTFTSKEGGYLEGEYRHLFESGQMELSGSITGPGAATTEVDRDVRGHIEAKGSFALSDKSSWGFDAKRASDDTYLRRYKFGDEDVLTSRLYTSRVDKHNIAHLEALSFQGLNVNDDPDTTPLIFPQGSFHNRFTSEEYKGNVTLEGNMLVLDRNEGVSSRRFSMTGGYHYPVTTSGGHVWEFSSSLRGDLYMVDDVPSTVSGGKNKDGFLSRAIPQVEAKWSYPVARKIAGRRLLIEPTVNMIASPYGNNSNNIPNEDSQDVEFSDENLFSSNHFTGYDRVESGPRVNYGVRASLFDAASGDWNMIFGQNYKAAGGNGFSRTTGLDDHFSDYVGRISYRKDDWFDISYRFRLDKESLSSERDEIKTSINIAPLTLNLDYLALNEAFDSTTGEQFNRKLALAEAMLDVTDRYTITGAVHRDMNKSDWISTEASLLYHGDCVTFSLGWLRDFTSDRDIRPNTTVAFNISLKNLGY